MLTRWWRWIAVVAVIAILLSVPRVRNILGRTILFVTAPVSKTGAWLNQLAGKSQHQPSFDQLARELHDVQGQLFLANQKLALAENVAALAAFQQTVNRRIVSATVITSSPDPGIQSIVINRGSDDGLRLGQAAVSSSGVVIGKIVAVHQTTSVILLLIDGQSVISGRVINDARSPGAVRGERGLALNMSFIPKHDQLMSGQSVVTSGSEASIPPDLLIGTVSTIHQRVGDLFQDIVVTPAADFQGLQVIGVVTG